jgi:hypothetical protein
MGIVGKLRIGFSFLGSEFLNKCKNVVMIFFEELFKMFGTVCFNHLFRVGDGSCLGKVFINLIV